MSRRRTTAVVVAGLTTFALAACGSAVSHASAPLGLPQHSVGPTAHRSSANRNPSTSKPPVSPKPHTPTPAAPINVPGITAKPHAVKLPAWPRVNGHLHGPVGSEGSTGTGSVALTFDDGPGPYTSGVLDLLDQYHVKATFCLIGRQIKNYRSLIARMINDGMTICNHSWNHDEKLGNQSVATIAANLRRTANAVHSINPRASVAYFRHPGGNFTPTAVSVCEQLGMRPLYWAVDTEDWTRPGTEEIIDSLTHKVHAGSIVLMHDGGGDRTQTIEALRTMLPKLAEKFHLVALPTARTATVIPPSLVTRRGPAPTTHPSAPAPSLLP